MEKLLLTVGEASSALSIGRSKTYELIRRGEIPSVRVGFSLRIPLEGLRRVIAERTTAAETDDGAETKTAAR